MAFMAVTALSGCTKGTESKSVQLDPDNPVSLTVWHYYNGAQQATFDELVSEFNATEGKEKGIYVEGYSQGSVSDLEKAISDSVAGVVGSQEMPDIFSTYADTAYSIEEQGRLTDLTQYFSQEELDEYVDSYIQEGYLHGDGALYLFPVAKSTEVMMLNATDWEPFAKDAGVTLEDLQTLEGVVDVAEKYYEWTDAQTPDVPDDVKTGDILAYTGSTSSAMYFPDQVVKENESEDIAYKVLPIPVLEGGEKVNVQQGAGMAVTKSDEQHEYAACEFLKWFTAKENNLRFVCESAYFPVRKESNSIEALKEVVRKDNLSIDSKAYDCLSCVFEDYDTMTFYTPKCFENGYATRKILDYNLSDKAVADKEAIDQAVQGGTSREEAQAPFLTEEAFEAWYQEISQALESAANP